MSQNLIDHVAILTSSALAVPQVNKLKPQRGPEYYAVIAFPPAAGAALHALCSAARTLSPDIQVNVKPNASTKKPIVGVPDDWLIVRASTQYAPYVADQAGKQLAHVATTPEQTAANLQAIRQQFYAGKRVRAALSAFPWDHPTGGKGVSFNIDGVMAVEDGERLAIGNGAMVNAFEKFAQAAGGGGSGEKSPFAGVGKGEGVQTETSKDPFAQKVPEGKNPFFA